MKTPEQILDEINRIIREEDPIFSARYWLTELSHFILSTPPEAPSSEDKERCEHDKHFWLENSIDQDGPYDYCKHCGAIR